MRAKSLEHGKTKGQNEGEVENQRGLNWKELSLIVGRNGIGTHGAAAFSAGHQSLAHGRGLERMACASDCFPFTSTG